MADLLRKFRSKSYNRALFESMSYMADAVWELDADTETIYIMHDQLSPELKGKKIPFFAIHEVLATQVHPDNVHTVIAQITPEFIRNLKQTDIGESKTLIDNRYHYLRTVMTPDISRDGTVHRAYYTLFDIQKNEFISKEITDVLDGANMGLWSMIIGDGAPRFYVDPTTARLVGCSPDVAPEEAYRFWHRRVVEEYVDNVNTCVEEILSGKPSEVVYPYNHPEYGIINIRCGGILDGYNSTRGHVLRGYHQDITEYNKQLADQIEKEKKERITLKSIASVYTTMHLIDIKGEIIEELGSTDLVHNYIDEHSNETIQDIIWGIMRKRICEAHQQRVLDFTDFSTLTKRLTGKSDISIEVLNADNIWYRFTFIRVENNSLDVNSLSRVVFVSKNIDDEKRREESLTLMSFTDILTKVYNRNAYETHIKNIEEAGIRKDMWYMSIDCNGMKQTNDNLGHAAGDEMIQAVADNLSSSVSSLGKVYRIGGDEFIVIMHATKKQADYVISQIEENKKAWKGVYSESYSFSKGIVCAEEIPGCTISDLEKEVDRRMYQEKKQYYMEKGNRRRRD